MSVCDRCEGDRGGCRCKELDRIADLEAQLAEYRRVDDLVGQTRPTHEVMVDWVNRLQRQLAEAQAENKRLRERCELLRDELEIATRDTDSYGVIGSEFHICTFCQAESGAGCLNKGIPHEDDCLLKGGKGCVIHQ